jgi:hypothetical protein
MSGFGSVAEQNGRKAAPDSAALLRRLVWVSGEIVGHEQMLVTKKAERDDLIRQLAGQGYSEREIASAANVSCVRVHQIKGETQ